MDREEAHKLLHKLVDDFVDADYEIPGMTAESWIRAFVHELGEELEARRHEGGE